MIRALDQSKIWNLCFSQFIGWFSPNVPVQKEFSQSIPGFTFIDLMKFGSIYSLSSCKCCIEHQAIDLVHQIYNDGLNINTNQRTTEEPQRENSENKF